jgi:peptide deformylase
MILPIYIYGQPVLRKISQDIEENYPDLDQLIEDMFQTLTVSDGVGLAAPQIGKNIRVVVIDLTVLAEDNPEYTNFKRAYINAHVIETNDEKVSMEEGCLSIPGIHENVIRPTRVHVKYLDQQMQSHDEWVEGYLARVMQHEFDHLDATMFVDKISPLRKQLVNGKLKHLIKGKVHCSYRYKAASK